MVSEIEDKLMKKCPSLHEYFSIIKRFCQQFWDNTHCVCRHYTKHDTRHSLKVLSYIIDLSRYCTPPLNPDEMYILLGSAYLHDISMQFPQYAIKKDISQVTYADCELIRKIQSFIRN